MGRGDKSNGNELIKVGSLLLGAVCLIGFVFLMASRSERIQEGLFEEIENMPELNPQQCPFDGSLVESTQVILFDFSDPLPVALRDFPARLLENMINNMRRADRFDRFGLYTLNPSGNTPRSIGELCVPVTLNQIPTDVRRALWGRDPDEHADLPPRYTPFLRVFERMWENERKLEQFMAELKASLTDQARSPQHQSRIIENIEEFVSLEIDRSGGIVEVILLSNMLQNSSTYSHYRNPWDFGEYRPRQSRSPPGMERFSFDIYLVQSCQSLAADGRRTLQKFWRDYFESAGASVTFKLLEIGAHECDGEAASPGPPAKQSVAEEPRRREPGFTDSSHSAKELARQSPTPAQAIAEPNASQAPVKPASPSRAGPASTPTRVDCPPPELQSRAPPTYPSRARGNATLRYELTVDSRGFPAAFELYEMIVTHKRYEDMFQESAEKYISNLRFKLRVSDACDGGRSALVTVRF